MKAKKTVLWVCVLALAAAVCLLGGCGKRGDEDRSKYTVSATVDVESDTAQVVCDIDYLNRTDVELGEIWFHLYPAAYRDGARFTPVETGDVAAAYPEGISYGGITIEEVTGGEYAVEGQDEDILVVKLPDSLMPTRRAKITVKYRLTIPHVRHRFGHIGDTVNLGNWYPIECVYDGGFVASPYYAAGDPFCLPMCDYDVSVTAPASYTAAMPAPSTRTQEGESATTRCTLTRARDFAVVLGKFQTAETKAGDARVTYYYTADADAEAHCKAAAQALTYFSEVFGAYPYDSFAVVQTPFHQGGMEYTGLVYVSDAMTGDRITEVIVHETAHQWWYGLVGNDQIRHAWLDESLAEYSTTLFYESHPEYGVTYDARIADAMGGFGLYCEMRKCEDTSMERAIPDFADTTEYTYMTYVKGQLLLDSLRTTLGKETMMRGLREYCKANAYTLATPAHFVAAMEKAAGRELNSFIESFLDGSAKLYSHA